MRTTVLIAFLLEVVIMSSGSNPASQSPKTGSQGERTLRAAQPRFCGKPNVAWLVAAKVEQTSREPTEVPGIFVANYRITFDINKVLPATELKQMVVTGKVGEGPEAGALGLQDWLPTKAGMACVLAFDPRDTGRAEQMTYLGGGTNAEQTWNDCKQFYDCHVAGGQADPNRVAAAIAREPLPAATFFRLIFESDRRAYDSDDVCKSLGDYLMAKQVPPLERRKVVAHYMSQPKTSDRRALQSLAGGMITLAIDLANANQEASAGVVFQRLLGFFRDPGTQTYLVEAPEVDEPRLEEVRRLLLSPAVGMDESNRVSLEMWLRRQIDSASTTNPGSL